MSQSDSEPKTPNPHLLKLPTPSSFSYHRQLILRSQRRVVPLMTLFTTVSTQLVTSSNPPPNSTPRLDQLCVQVPNLLPLHLRNFVTPAPVPLAVSESSSALYPSPPETKSESLEVVTCTYMLDSPSLPVSLSASSSLNRSCL